MASSFNHQQPYQLVKTLFPMFYVIFSCYIFSIITEIMHTPMLVERGEFRSKGSGCQAGRTIRKPAGCHELAFFTFFSLLFYCIDTCRYSPKSYVKHKLTLLINHSVFLLCFRPSRKSKSACIQSHNVANTTLKLQQTARFKARRNNRAI